MNTNTSTRKILITGGAGFIGSHTSELLIDNGYEVLAVDNLATGHQKNLDSLSGHERFRFEESDVAIPGALEGLVKTFQPQAIIHLAALVSVQESILNPALNFERNVLATHLVIDAARLNQVGRIVFASSAAIFGDTADLPLKEDSAKRPLSPYGAVKLASECLFTGAANAYGFSVVANRYFNVYGPRQDPKSPYSGVMSIFLDRLRSNREVTVFGDGKQTRDFIFVKDVAKMNMLAATSVIGGFNAFNVCTGRSTSLLDLLDAFRSYLPESPEPKFAEARKGDILHSLGCPDAAKIVLGFEANVSLKNGLGQYLKGEGILV